VAISSYFRIAKNQYMITQHDFKRWNTILGWVSFLIAFIVYMITLEPTASWWDCGEYISTAYKLQVGHPPGAPTFQLLGRFFSLFAFGDTSKVAMMINGMSAFSSALTILFLFWTITLLARKLVKAGEGFTQNQAITIFGSAFCRRYGIHILRFILVFSLRG
jgi:hypothetical protein